MPTSFLRRYRFEDFINELDAYMKANLGSYIDQMNADLTDLALLKPEAGAYFFQTLMGTDVPFKIFVYYGETGTETDTTGPEQKGAYEIQVAIILANSNELQHIMGKRLLRYRDCLIALFNDGWNKVNKRIKLEVAGISPFPFSVVNQAYTHVGIGVTLKMEIA